MWKISNWISVKNSDTLRGPLECLRYAQLEFDKIEEFL